MKPARTTLHEPAGVLGVLCNMLNFCVSQMFCDDLESWRQRYRQRAELHGVLKVRLKGIRRSSLGLWSALKANILSITIRHDLRVVTGLEPR